MHELIDLGHQSLHTAESPGPNRSPGDPVEPDRHLVQPGSVGRREVHVKAWPRRRPALDARMLVRGLVVHNHVHVQFRRHVPPADRREVFRQTAAHEGSSTTTGSLYLQTPTHRALCDVCSQMFQVLILVGIDFFPLQRLHEAFATGIVVGVRRADSCPEPCGTSRGWLHIQRTRIEILDLIGAPSLLLVVVLRGLAPVPRW